MSRMTVTSAPFFAIRIHVAFIVVGLLAVMAIVDTSDTGAVEPAVFRHEVVDSAGPENMHVKSVGDINGDGFVDLVVAGTGGELVWYASPNWAKHVVSTDGGGWSTDAEVADIDRDGDMDIVISDWYVNNRLVWFENFKAKGRSWRMHLIGNVRAHDIELADLDADGDLDVITRQQGEAGKVLEVWLQDSLWKWNHRQVKCPIGEGFDVADVDGDGDPDIVIGGSWYETPADVAAGRWVEHVFTTAWTHPHCVVLATDLNADGHVDVVLTPAENRGGVYRIAWYEGSSK